MSALRVLIPGLALVAMPTAATPAESRATNWEWQALPDLPAPVGVAGPFVGVHSGALIVAGGANFPRPVWENDKTWHDDTWVLIQTETGALEWQSGVRLDRPVAYGACVSTPIGVACMGGSDGEKNLSRCFLLQWNSESGSLEQRPLPELPEPCAHGAAAGIGEVVYLAAGQRGPGLDSAGMDFWRLDLSRREEPGEGPGEGFRWEKLPPWPGPARAFHLLVAQHNGFDDCIYLISGRRQEPESGDSDSSGGIVPLTDVWEFNPRRYDPDAFNDSTGRYTGTGRFARPWRRRTDAPSCVMAGAGVAVGQSHILVVSGADGSLFEKAGELRERHPGFPRRMLLYHTITDTWVSAGESPANHVTTPAVRWGERIILASGEIRPRERSRRVWSIEPVRHTRSFGALNFTVLIVYLLAMVGVGLLFIRKNRQTDDYFRGGQRIPWWVAGCSIFATMLSSITYMAIPAKAYAQDWVYMTGNFMIIAVAPVAVFVALPFFRQIDATSAYEYLEKRFSRPVRWFGSVSFTVFHTFRMGIVMSLAGLALAMVTQMTATECVLVLGVLSIIYCTAGGLEAVVWTDTLQTFVLLGGAFLCLALMLSGSEGGPGQFFSAATAADKFHFANLHWDATSASLALWVVVLGGFGQHFSSYTSDQAVIQRYMTTPTRRRAAAAIWTNAILSGAATVLFFAVGTALYVFYRSHPEKLDPTGMTDQVFPLFIAQEVPAGIAGLIVAGIFAAAQSTISTSMNSTASTVVTDFLRPRHVARSEAGYLRWARGLTLLFGVVGTLLALLFVDPGIKSLFDQFIKVIGIFMGVLGGLFALGILTRRANGPGSLVGALAGAVVVGLLPLLTRIQGFLYSFTGISVCFVVGYVASRLLPGPERDLTGLTLHTRQPAHNRVAR